MTGTAPALRLRRLVLGLHAGLATAATLAALTIDASLAAHGLVLAVGLTALGLTARGVAAKHRNNLTYAALVLVVLIGVTTAEVVASADRATFTTLVLVLALVELAALVLLARVSA